MTASSAPSASPRPAADAGVKPSLRGVSHLVAFGFSLVLGPLLVIQASTPTARWSSAVYATCLVALFGCSALLHRVDWSPTVRPWMRRLDHSTIFLFIAGTYTPIVVLALPSGQARWILAAVWIGAAAGIAVTIAWIDAPRFVTAGSYVVVGWIAAMAIPDLWSALGASRFALLVVGALLYTAGAVVYARKSPDPVPHVFGYHEVFHALVIAAVACHYVLITGLVRG